VKRTEKNSKRVGSRALLVFLAIIVCGLLIAALTRQQAVEPAAPVQWDENDWLRSTTKLDSDIRHALGNLEYMEKVGEAGKVSLKVCLESIPTWTKKDLADPEFDEVCDEVIGRVKSAERSMDKPLNEAKRYLAQAAQSHVELMTLVGSGFPMDAEKNERQAELSLALTELQSRMARDNAARDALSDGISKAAEAMEERIEELGGVTDDD